MTSQHSDEYIRAGVFAALNKADIYDVEIHEITILHPDAGDTLDGRWHLLPYGPTHGFWEPYKEFSVTICDGLLDIYPVHYCCGTCLEEYPGGKEAYDKAWEGIDPDTPGVVA